MACSDGGDGFERLLLAHLHVDDDLRKDLEIGGELVDGFAGAGDQIEHDKGGEQAVAGGGQMREEDVAGLLAAEGRVVLLHLFQHVAVAHRRAQHADAAALERGFEAHVGHGGGDDQIACQHAARLQVARGHQQDGVAVDHVALRAGQHAAVGVAVKSQANICAARSCTSCGDEFGMQRPAVGIDVAAVGRDVEQGDLGVAIGIEAAKELRRDGGGGAVGAIGHDLQTGEREAGNAIDEELDVVGLEVRDCLRPAEAARIGDLRPGRRGEESPPPWPARPHRGA